MDHRAEKEAEAVNKTNHPILQSVGGKISLEMQVPKLMWLKKNLQETWKNAEHFFDLPDFLTWKATGAESRYLYDNNKSLVYNNICYSFTKVIYLL